MSDDRVVRIVVALVVVLVFAVVGAHRRVRDMERRLGVSVLISAGLPFLALGAVLRHPTVGILTPELLVELAPAFDFVVAWIGFSSGLQFDLRRLDEGERSMGGAIAAHTLAPMALVALAGAGVLVLVGGIGDARGLFEPLVLLGACAAPSAPMVAEAIARPFGERAARALGWLSDFDELVPLVLLLVVAIVARPTGTGAGALPAGAWLLVTLGTGALLGATTFLLLRTTTSSAEELAMLLGAVALVAGVARHLALQVVVVAALAGFVLANLRLPREAASRKAILDFERPLTLLLLVLVGAMWRWNAWQAWALTGAFVFARIAGKRIGAWIATRVGPAGLPPPRAVALALLPQSPLAIVIVASVAAGRGASSPFTAWILHAVVAGGIVTELLAHLSRGDLAAAAASSPTPAEEVGS